MTRHTQHRRIKILWFLLFWLATLGLIGLNQQRLVDWWKLRGYTPAADVAAITQEDTMTPYAKHLFYVNKPDITVGPDFIANCPLGSEKTVILGCYKGGDAGIYVYKVSDARLNGVIEVTAAHEMLHAAYARLSTSERRHVDIMLYDYYAHTLQDQRIKDTIALYEKSEPTELNNEMHSIFGTEIAVLPAPLETYYRQYFTNRSVVVGYTARYQVEFTSRQNQVTAYDAQLKVLKTTIDNEQSSLSSQRATLMAQLSSLSAPGSRDDPNSYNTQVSRYNQAVVAYNRLLAQARTDIGSYNTLVDKRNAIALEEQQLSQALEPQSLPELR
jgi:uncharacterized protein YukE